MRLPTFALLWQKPRSTILEGKQTPVTVDILVSLQLGEFSFSLFVSLSKPNHHLEHRALLPNDILYHHRLSIVLTLFGIAANPAYYPSDKEKISRARCHPSCHECRWDIGRDGGLPRTMSSMPCTKGTKRAPFADTRVQHVWYGLLSMIETS